MIKNLGLDEKGMGSRRRRLGRRPAVVTFETDGDDRTD